MAGLTTQETYRRYEMRQALPPFQKRAWAEDRYHLVSAARSGRMRKLQRLWWDSQITKSKPIVIASNEVFVTSQLAFLD